MAKIKLGPFAADIRNRIGGVVFSKNSAGNYIRRGVTPVNPQSVAQQQSRQFLTQTSQSWRNLTDDERNNWNQVKDSFKKTDIFGNSLAPTGFNLFTRLNRNILEISETVLTAAPLPAAVQGFLTLDLVANTTGGLLTLTFTPAIDAFTKVIVFATAAQSAGVTFVKAEFRKIDVLDVADLSPVELAAVYITKFGALPAVGAKVFVQIKPINIATGLSGTPIKASAIAI